MCLLKRQPWASLDVLRFSRLGRGPRRSISARCSGIPTNFKFADHTHAGRYALPGRARWNGVARGGIGKEELSDPLSLTKPREGQQTQTTEWLIASSYPTSPSVVQEGEEAFRNFSRKPQPFPMMMATVYRKTQMCVLRPRLPLCCWMTLRNTTHCNYYSSNTFIIIIIITHQTFRIFPIIKHSVHTIAVYWLTLDLVTNIISIFHEDVQIQRVGNCPKFAQRPLSSSINWEYYFLPHRAVMSFKL